MSVVKPILVSALLLSLSACDGGSSESSRTSENVVTGSAISGESNSENNAGADSTNNTDYYIDPTSAEFIESNPQHFRNAVVGAWAATDCQQVDDAAAQAASAHTVFVFTDTELIETEYSFESTDCTGIASSKWYPLPIRSWTLGEYRTLLDGSGAWELDTSITQRGIYGTDVGKEVGTDSYVNIGFVGGELEFNTLIENYKHTRPATRSGIYFKKLAEGREVQSISADALLGNWYASCTGRLESSYEFYADKLVITDENWADVGCEGDSYAVRKTTFDLQYGDPFTSLFEDELIPITLTAVSNELLKFDDSQGLDKPEFKVQEGKTEYRAININSNTLLLAYCLNRNNGEDDCQDSEDRVPDMVDYNWAVRFDRVL